MEKVYDLTNESEYFRNLCCVYCQLEQPNYPTTFANINDPLDCHELLRFAVHQAQCGENVYMLNFPRQVEVLHRPDTLFFLEKWSEFLDITDVDHALILAISNRNQYDHHKINETFYHMRENFKSTIAITFNN